jgi:amidase
VGQLPLQPFVQCANPYALDRSPCGSSSGSAAAVSGNLAPLAVGTETDGSVVCPSATCGIVGIKPTLGLISRSGIVPISHNQDTAGPMARSVADAATLLAVLAGRDPRDEATAPLVGKPAVDYTSFLVPGGLKGARIGVPRARFFGYSPDADAVAEEALEVMKREGAVLVDPADIPHAGDYDDEEFTVLLYDFKADLNAYLAALGPDAPVHSLADVIAFNAAHRLEEMPYFGQETMVMAEDKGPLTDEKYVKALEKCRRLARQEGIDAVMEKLSLDALVAPTGAPAWTIDLVNGDHYLGSSSTPAAVSGYPSITVPAGYAFGLPVGVSFIGRPWSEGPLIRLAHAFETAAQARRRPRFLATADLGTGRAT